MSSNSLSYIKDGLREVNIQNAISMYESTVYHTKKLPLGALSYVFFKLNKEIDKEFFEMIHYKGRDSLIGRYWSIHGIDIDLYIDVDTDIVYLKISKNKCFYIESMDLNIHSHKEVIKSLLPYYLLKVRFLWNAFNLPDPSQ